MPKREIFIASSREANSHVKALAECLREALGADYHVVPWWETRWNNLATALESLRQTVREYDYAVFFCHPDDKVNIRGIDQYQTRDNVIFEFGLFLPVLGNERTFLIRPDNSGPAYRVLTDLGESANVQTYKFSEPTADKDVDAAPTIDPQSFRVASLEVAARIKRDVAQREAARANATTAKAKLIVDLDTYQAEIHQLAFGHASDTRLLNVAGEHIKDFLALKASATGRTVQDAVEDLGMYFQFIDDLLNISQLAARQRKDNGVHPIDEVWVFADDPLEFSDEVTGKAELQIPKLRDTIRYNLISDVHYYYFVNYGYQLHTVKGFLDQWKVPTDKWKNLQFFRLAKTAFKTYYTIHKYEKKVREIYMSAIMQERNDLLIRVSAIQRGRIYRCIESLIGFETRTSHGLDHRDFYL